ncbi:MULTISPECIES: sulfotransferase family 2 domain-containing protein [Aminobacter]|jgi:hypothetical protein|uniref:Sulfotransferase family protein n=2 Tax=Aminobacter TaxID=31988 RepID=A0AAC8YKW6_AMIAI|nr:MULTISPECIES: sulfotransferase family 2 domain-containing protein [Aminobacter]AMS39956.1 hypothetical protein AA2016_1018 [Aminobacter aminovorans]MBA8906275.1 hypothetical protein [Aminobacter ciceronei]MBA9020054.1 hypothetical protein [Aminobacter ciceronei]MBB3707244.1 hypothetical protein [Aminobacter aminovorans]MRX36186.1 hypothetical protein [Aminobacter sp. MDW-2]
MPTGLRFFDATYYPVPKSGSSSVKYLLMQVAGAHQALDNPDDDVHHHLGTNLVDPFRPMHNADAKPFTIVRDPVERLLSAYSDRVVKAGLLTSDEADSPLARELGLSLEPDLETFILRVEDYCRICADVRFHVASPRYFLGSNLFLFDRVFKLEKIDQVAAYISEIVGQDVSMPHIHVSSGQASPSDLSPAALAKALRFCRYDYAFLVDLYDAGRWGTIPRGTRRDPSTLSVYRDPAKYEGDSYPRTPRNLRNFLSKRPLDPALPKAD